MVIRLHKSQFLAQKKSIMNGFVRGFSFSINIKKWNLGRPPSKKGPENNFQVVVF